MPTLLQISSALNIGSVGRIEEQIAMKSQAHGWDCHIAHGGRYVGESQFDAIKISSRLDNYIHAFAGEFLGMHGFGSVYSTKQFINRINEINPDIVHIHNIHGYYLNIKILFDYLASKGYPIIWTLHDCWSFTGHCTHFENANCDKWKTECNHCPLQMAQYKSRLIDRSRKNFVIKKDLYEKLNNLTIVPVSYWLGGLVSQSILKHFPIHVIQNGINIDLFKPTTNSIKERYNIPNNKIMVLGVLGSGFGVEKGKKEFIKLADNDRIQVVLVGLTKNDAKGLPQNIIKIGRTSSQSELAEYYSSADVFLNPTYNDTFPTTNIESLACGTPVITYNTGGSPETIDEATGVVVEKGDFKGLIEAISAIHSNGKELYSTACRERAIKHFNKEERFEDYVTLYDRILNY